MPPLTIQDNSTQVPGNLEENFYILEMPVI